MPTPTNTEKLAAFVQARLDDGRPEVLRKGRDTLEQFLGQLAQDPCPPHLIGVSAFDLSDGMEQLAGALVRTQGPSALWSEAVA